MLLKMLTSGLQPCIVEGKIRQDSSDFDAAAHKGCKEDKIKRKALCDGRNALCSLSPHARYRSCLKLYFMSESVFI